MSTKKLSSIVCASVLIAGSFAVTASAQTADRRTIFTFSGPVAIPGATLPAGKYVFRLASPQTSARVVQVFSANGRRAYGMFFSYPVERPDASSNPEVRFMETAKGVPSAIKTWWYPGERTGFEFVYPKDQARRLAQGTKESVLTTQGNSTTAEQTNTSRLARVSPTGEETNVTPAPAPPASPTGVTQEGTVADSSLAFPDAPPANSEQSGAIARSRLPNTASSLPTIALLGLGALAAAASLRLWRVAGSRGSVKS